LLTVGSIIAAAAAKGLRGSAHWDNVSSHEARGISFAVGGDSGAVTIPNMLKKYSPQLNGASISEHEIELCRFGVCSLEQCDYSYWYLNIFGLLSVHRYTRLGCIKCSSERLVRHEFTNRSHLSCFKYVLDYI
jgi:hypothetical protein